MWYNNSRNRKKLVFENQIDRRFAYDGKNRTDDGRLVDTVSALEENWQPFGQHRQNSLLYTGTGRLYFPCSGIGSQSGTHSAGKDAVAETGMGVVEDKVIKNNYAAEYIYNAYKDTKTCGVVEEDKAFGTKRIAEPIGVIAAVIPTTNPTSTAISRP